MRVLIDEPFVLFLATLALLWIAGRAGGHLRKHYVESHLDESAFNLALGATLTLMGLIIGFTFSAALSRYDQRKNYEEQEATAIATEYVRLGTLVAGDAAKVRALLRNYVDQRIVYYTSRNTGLLLQAKEKTEALHAELWAGVTAPATAEPTAVSALLVSGMNDVLNAEGYTEAAWRNRIPVAAWGFLISIAAFCNLLLGYRAHHRGSRTMLILPIALALSFFLIAEIDSPRSRVLRLHAQNLESLAECIRQR